MTTTKCEVCGRYDATTTGFIPLWNFGIREVKRRDVCKSCLFAHKKGEL